MVTGGAGFIGSTLIKQLLRDTGDAVVNVDNLTYAGNLDSLTDISNSPRYRFERADICDLATMRSLFARYRPGAVMHLAAESHVDRSIDGPAAFIQTNIVGTSVLLEAAREYWKDMPSASRDRFRLVHVSTDEVYGSIDGEERFTEASPYRPTSPYAASKASADHLARAWQKTYGLPVLITNCGNNYGPFQFPEKLIPLMLFSAIEEKPLPVYGDGQNVRDWIFVEDHCAALCRVLEKGSVGETYLIGADSRVNNLQLVEMLCQLLDELVPRRDGKRYRELISFVEDRPGHDRRYALDPQKVQRELDWRPTESFSSGLRKTVQWYLNNRDWCNRVMGDRYRGGRLGLGT
jgi:dTDP-glucose 4,6-dehydratase